MQVSRKGEVFFFLVRFERELLRRPPPLSPASKNRFLGNRTWMFGLPCSGKNLFLLGAYVQYSLSSFGMPGHPKLSCPQRASRFIDRRGPFLDCCCAEKGRMTAPHRGGRHGGMAGLRKAMARKQRRAGISLRPGIWAASVLFYFARSACFQTRTPRASCIADTTVCCSPCLARGLAMGAEEVRGKGSCSVCCAACHAKYAMPCGIQVCLL